MRFRRIVAIFSLVAFATTSSGCFGSFTATQGLYNFNKNISSNGFVQWIVFLVMVILPVYELGILIDVIILNLIEFWTGSNPMAAAGEQPEKTVVLENGATLHMKRISEDAMQITIERDGETMTRTLQMTDDGMRALDTEGVPVGILTDDAAGVHVTDPAGNVLYSASEEEQQMARRAYEKGGVPAMLGTVDRGPTTVAGY